ncbi:MAG: peptidase M64 [Bacteroidaceae bacterium]|nr:peptidase M64 [Bacteroidaceae bacterium]
MKNKLFIYVLLLIISAPLNSQDKTLRVNYTFSGNSKESRIYLDDLNVIDGWVGRRVNLKDLYLAGNGQITMTDAATGDTLFRNSFSTLFQEWQNTEEATQVDRSFENVFLLPMPTDKVVVEVKLTDNYNKVVATMRHTVDPEDILIRRIGQNPPKWKYLHQGGSPEDCIDVVIVPEGYTADEMELFYKDAGIAVNSLLSHEPFKTMQERFNILAVELASKDGVVSDPKNGLWTETALSSHFSTFYSDRYLTTLRLRQLHDRLAGVPYEHIIILANTDVYGGGGIYNSYTLTTAHHAQFAPVVVHEFGHSFGGLADEYYYDDQYEQFYNSETEPWEPNLTTQVDFDSKWKDMIPAKVEQPTPVPVNDPRSPMTDKQRKAVEKLPPVGLYEGGGYMSKGVWRGSFDCRMHTNTYPEFCPVCRRSLERIIRFYTEPLADTSKK